MNKGKMIQSVERACDILEAVARENEIGVTDLSKKLGLHVATAHNLIRTLTARNYLINANGRYRLGPAVPALSAQWNPALALPNLLRPYAEYIADRTGESAVATILVGFRAEMIIYIPGTGEITVQFPHKVWDHPLNLATGRILAAFQPRTIQDEFVRRHMADGYGQDALQNRTREDWCREFKHIAAEEMAVIRRPNLDSASSFAAPVWNADKKTVIAALGVSCPNFRLTKDYTARLQKTVNEAARQASRFLQGKATHDLPLSTTRPERKKNNDK